MTAMRRSSKRSGWMMVDVDVAHENTAGNGSPGFVANTGSSSLEREATGAQDARTGASSAVDTEEVNGTAAVTGGRVTKASEAGGAATRGKPASPRLEGKAVRTLEANGPD